MLFVFNKTPGRFTQERKNEAMAIIRSEIRNVLGSDIYDKVPFVFVKNFGDDDFGPNPYTRPDFKEAQADLHKSIFNRVRHGHRKVKEIELNPNREMLNSLKEQIAQMTKDMAENQRKYNDQLLQIQRENERAMREANENFQRAMAARPPEVHHHHHSSGPSCVIC